MDSDICLFEDEVFTVGMHVTIVTTPSEPGRRTKSLRSERRLTQKVQRVDAGADNPQNNPKIGHVLGPRSRPLRRIAPKESIIESSSNLAADVEVVRQLSRRSQPLRTAAFNMQYGPTPIFDDAGNFVIDAEDLRDDPVVASFWGRRLQPIRKCKISRSKRLLMTEAGTQVNRHRVRKPYTRQQRTEKKARARVEEKAVCSVDHDSVPDKTARNIMVQTGRIRPSNPKKRPSLKTNQSRLEPVPSPTTKKMVNAATQTSDVMADLGPFKRLSEGNAENGGKLARGNSESAKELVKDKPEITKEVAGTIKANRFVNSNGNASTTTKIVKLNAENRRLSADSIPKKTVKDDTTTLKKLVQINDTAQKKTVTSVAGTSHPPTDSNQKQSVRGNDEISNGKKRGLTKKKTRGEAKKKQGQASRPPRTRATNKAKGRLAAHNDPDLGICHVLRFKKHVYYPQKAKGDKTNKTMIHSMRLATAVTRGPHVSAGIGAPATSKPVTRGPHVSMGVGAPSMSKVVSRGLPASTGVGVPSTSKTFGVIQTSKVATVVNSSARIGQPMQSAVDVGLSPTRKAGAPRTVGVRLVAELENPVVTDNTTTGCEGNKRPKGRPKQTEAEKTLGSPRKRRRPDKSLTCPVCSYQDDYITLIMRHIGVEHPGIAAFLRCKLDSPFDSLWDKLPHIVNNKIVADKPTERDLKVRADRNVLQIMALIGDKDYAKSETNIMKVINDAFSKGAHLQVPRKPQKTVVGNKRGVGSKNKVSRRLKLTSSPSLKHTVNTFRSKSCIPSLPAPFTFENNEALDGPGLSSATIKQGHSQTAIRQEFHGTTANTSSTSSESSSTGVSRYIEELEKVWTGEYSDGGEDQFDVPPTVNSSTHDQGESTVEPFDSPRSSSSAYFSASSYIPETFQNNYYNLIKNPVPNQYALDVNWLDSSDQGGLPGQAAPDGLSLAATSRSAPEPTNDKPHTTNLEAELSSFINIGKRLKAAQQDEIEAYSVGQQNLARKVPHNSAGSATPPELPERRDSSEKVRNVTVVIKDMLDHQYETVCQTLPTLEATLKECAGNSAWKADAEYSNLASAEYAARDAQVQNYESVWHHKTPEGLLGSQSSLANDWLAAQTSELEYGDNFNGVVHSSVDLLNMYNVYGRGLTPQLDVESEVTINDSTVDQ